MHFFTADEHYGHKNIIKYASRPFSSVEEMDEILISRLNGVVLTSEDVVIHAGDFTLGGKDKVLKYMKRLNGKHVFLEGSHDRLWPGCRQIWEKSFGEGVYVVVCHYAMRTWARSHYGSFQLHGHSHGRLAPIGKQMDIGVDVNGFAPVSLDEVVEIMTNR